MRSAPFLIRRPGTQFSFPLPFLGLHYQKKNNDETITRKIKNKKIIIIMDAHFLVAARLPKIPITSSLLEVRKKNKVG
jgi:hypothetical protein